MPPRLTGKNHGSKGGGGSKAGDRGGGKAGGGGGGGGGGRGKSDESRETGISKAMSYVLRHGAQKEGLRLDERGYADVADLVSFVCVFFFFSSLLCVYFWFLGFGGCLAWGFGLNVCFLFVEI